LRGFGLCRRSDLIAGPSTGPGGVTGIGLGKLEHCLLAGEKDPVPLAVRQETDLCVALALIGFETQRNLAVLLNNPAFTGCGNLGNSGQTEAQRGNGQK